MEPVADLVPARASVRPASRPRPTVGLRRRWVRVSAPWLTLVAVLVATPGAADVAHELLPFETAVSCCGEPCDEGDGHCDPRSCADCRCHAHPSAIAVAPQAVLVEPAPSDPSFAPCVDRACASGHRAPPFRPPAA